MLSSLTAVKCSKIWRQSTRFLKTLPAHVNKMSTHAHGLAGPGSDQQGVIYSQLALS